MLKEMILQGFQREHDYNCAEAIVYGANEAYHLGLDKEALKMSAPFGGGMGIQGVCGAASGALMVIGIWFADPVQHQSPMVRERTFRFFDEFKEIFGHLDCSEIKDDHWTPEQGCKSVVAEAAGILDKMYEELQA
jgi:C_GCAxxG_C_C family probable redox protein